LASQFVDDGLSADWENVRAPLQALLVLAQDFGTRFAAAKRDLAGIDFADLEQFALQLLWDAGGSDRRGKRVVRAIRTRFRGRMPGHQRRPGCDLRALSCDGEKPNRFLVGE